MGELIPFAKMSGSGNDFIVIDNRAGIIPADRAAAFTRLVCRPRVSLGADGVVLISDPHPPVSPREEPADFHWRYLNADGSDGEMCGNGAMCGARFAYLSGIAPANCTFQTASGLVQASVDPDPASPRVRLAMVDTGPVQRDLTVDAAGRSLLLHAVVVGVPHAVAIVDDVDLFAPGEALVPVGRAVRHHATFAPAGTNLNVVAPLGGNRLRMRTYERGVEAETLACGTGAVASAIVGAALGLVSPPVEVVASGGGVLIADFGLDPATDRGTAVSLAGDAALIARGELWPDAWRPESRSVMPDRSAPGR